MQWNRHGAVNSPRCNGALCDGWQVVPLFADLKEAQLETLAALFQFRRMEKGDKVFSEVAPR